MTRFLLFILIAASVALPGVSNAQSLRYQTLTAMFAVQHTDSSMYGDVTYVVSPARSSVRDIHFTTRGLRVGVVTMNDVEIPFTHLNDTLHIALDSPLRFGGRYRVQIVYSTSATYGLHRWPKNVLWTSLLPGAQSSWLPLPIEPNVRLTTNIQFAIPERYQAITAGKPIASEQPYTHWKSDAPVPLSGMMIAVGNLDLRVQGSGTYQLVLPDDRWETDVSTSVVDLLFLNRKDSEKEVESDRLRLALDIRIEDETQVVIRVRPISGRARGNITLPLVQHLAGTIVPFPLTVASSGDVIRLSVVSRLDNIMVDDRLESIDIIETKPGRFWLYQLRTSPDPAHRLEAAEALGVVTDAPDIGLALSQFFRHETDPNVKAALLTSYAAQSAGRIGSHPLILNTVRDKGDLRLVAMRALKRYSQSEPVKEAVSQIIRTSDDIPLVNEALITYRSLVPASVSDDLMRRLLNEDNDGDFALTILEAFLGRAEALMVSPRAAFYLQSKFDIRLRITALSILKVMEKDPSYWRDVFARYSEDPDPRFRNALLDAVTLLAESDRNAFLSNRLHNEYDSRVRNRILGLD